MLEFEKKIKLYPSEYFFLTNVLYAEYPSFIQINHYYDTADMQLNDSGTTYRVRENQGTYIATAKYHSPKNKECSVEDSETIEFLPETINYRGKSLRRYGSLKTERKTITVTDGVAIMLDKNRYLNFTDYELEIEYRHGCEKVAREALKRINTSLYDAGYTHDTVEIFERRVSHSKSKRFFERYVATVSQKGK